MNPKHPDLALYSEQELEAELARRRARQPIQNVTEMEDLLERKQGEAHHHTMEEYFRQKSEAEDGSKKPCPRCGKPTEVRAKKRPRTVRTLSGEITFCRNYHYCDACKEGFSPLDGTLGLLPQGELTPKMEARVLDFGVNAPYEEAAARWRLHYRVSLSEQCFKSVVERVGSFWCQASPENRQELLTEEETIPSRLVVQVDGSMVSTREQGWKEAKVAVLYREEHHVPAEEGVRGQVTKARYVAGMEGQAAFTQ